MHCAAATSPLVLDTHDHLRCNQTREPNTAHHFRMPAKRVIPQSSDSDAPIVVTPRKNTSSLSALLNQDVLMSRASSKLAGRTDSPATPSHRSKVASPSAAPPKLVKVAAAAARRRASKPRMTALSSAGTNPGPVPEISSSTFYPAKEAEWTKRLARIVGASAAGVDLADPDLQESYLSRVKLVPKLFEKPNNRGSSNRKKLSDALDFRDDLRERRLNPIKKQRQNSGVHKNKGGRPKAKNTLHSTGHPTAAYQAVSPKTVLPQPQSRKFSEARAARADLT